MVKVKPKINVVMLAVKYGMVKKYRKGSFVDVDAISFPECSANQYDGKKDRNNTQSKAKMPRRNVGGEKNVE